MSSLLVLGGARSGKSRHAVGAQPARGRVTFIATAEAGDADMAARIARHRAERPSHWTTVEEPLDVAARLDTVGRPDAVVIDCVTVWVANLMLRGEADDAILARVDALASRFSRAAFDVTLISNEVGEGVHPPTEDGLRFRDLLGIVNQRLAAACDRVVLMVAGLPLTLKAAGSRGNPVEAP
jgi:adenosylcobinamide kinase/adenosylcobinamide-phosphate guanylyltransferase